VLSDPVLYEFIEEAPPVSVEALAARYERLARRTSTDGTQRWLNWAICEGDGRPCGYVQATVLDDRRAWIAYVLARPRWGQGIATRATAAMIDYLGRELGVRRLLASVDARNAASIALLERLAFIQAGASEAAAVELQPADRLYVRAG
jgi:RimJ/RimL family protein N-acetyltransferase